MCLVTVTLPSLHLRDSPSCCPLAGSRREPSRKRRQRCQVLDSRMVAWTRVIRFVAFLVIQMHLATLHVQLTFLTTPCLRFVDEATTVNSLWLGLIEPCVQQCKTVQELTLCHVLKSNAPTPVIARASNHAYNSDHTCIRSVTTQHCIQARPTQVRVWFCYDNNGLYLGRPSGGVVYGVAVSLPCLE